MSLDELRIVAALGLMGLLVLLRFDAARFEAAEYDPGPGSDSPGALITRGVWPILAMVLASVVAVVMPNGWSALGYDRSTLRAGATIGLALVGAGVGMGAVLGFAWWRGRRWPPRLIVANLVPRAILNAFGTAVLDEVVFRGAVMGWFIAIGFPAVAALLVQDLLYGLATRLGSTNETLPLLAAALILGLATGWVTLVTGGVVAPIAIHAVSRFTALAAEDGLIPLVSRRAT